MLNTKNLLTMATVFVTSFLIIQIPKSYAGRELPYESLPLYLNSPVFLAPGNSFKPVPAAIAPPPAEIAPTPPGASIVISSEIATDEDLAKNKVSL